MMITADITGSLVLATFLGLILTAYLINLAHEGTPVFPDDIGESTPGRCSCGAPHVLKPFPGDVPVLAAPVAELAPAERDDDTTWNRHHIADVWERLRAEAGGPR